MTTKKVSSAVPFYIAGGVWVLCGLIFPLYKLGFIILTAALSAAAYVLFTAILPKKEIEVPLRFGRTGNATVDDLLRTGQQSLAKLKELNNAISDEKLSAYITRMEASAAEIFKYLCEHNDKSVIVKKFLNYYLPTSIKLLETYRTVCESGTEGENTARTKQSVENSLSMIADAFEKQADALYADQALDIETDVEVLENMMSADGLTGKNSISEAAAPAKSDPVLSADADPEQQKITLQ